VSLAGRVLDNAMQQPMFGICKTNVPHKVDNVSGYTTTHPIWCYGHVQQK